MSHYRWIVGDKCTLSPVMAEDGEKWAAWFNDLDVTVPLGDEAYTVNSLENQREDALQVARGRDAVFSILRSDTGEVIGRCLLFAVNRTDRSAMAGILIGEKSCWGQGYGSEAMVLLLDYAFNLLNLHSVGLGVFAFNQRGIASYRKIGFKEIGLRREARILGGKAFDVLLMDILEDEFRSRHPSRALAGRLPGACDAPLTIRSNGV